MLKRISTLLDKPRIRSALGYRFRLIEYWDRQSKKRLVEKVYGEDAMKVFYGSPRMTRLMSRIWTNPLVSSIYGAYHDSFASRSKVPEFIKLMGIDVTECEKSPEDYASFNEFFARKLKPAARPIDPDPRSVVSPGDGRLLVFPRIGAHTLSYVKWAPIRLLDLFNGDAALEARYQNGSCIVLRLCPSDYHRFHFPLAGKAGITKTVPGLLHSVNPMALEQGIPVFCLNKRTMCELETPAGNRVLLMEVGAVCVGTIVQTYRPTMDVAKGDEKGLFRFGGSTCLAFFEPGAVTFDEDLIAQSAAGLETYVKMGERIGLSAV